MDTPLSQIWNTEAEVSNHGGKPFQHHSIGVSLWHLALMGLIPAACGYFSLAHMGWQLNQHLVLRLGETNAIVLAGLLYAILFGYVLLMGTVGKFLARGFAQRPRFSHTLELVAYAATPIFMSGFAMLYPQLWFIALSFVAALLYSTYLLIITAPSLLHIKSQRSILFSTGLITCTLILVLVATGVIVSLTGSEVLLQNEYHVLSSLSQHLFLPG